MESEFISGFKVLLTAAQYYENGVASGHCNTSYTYDLMGNILSLKRNGLQDDGVYGAVDNLTYTYNGNQVVKVDDTVDGPYYKDAFHFVDGANEDTEYEYDGNGNMTKDLNKKISQIEYNCLNLPQRISYQDGSRVLYTYDAGGVKLRTDYYINPLASSVPQVAGGTGSAGTTLKHTWTDYCGNFIYENDSLKQTLVPDGYVSYLYSQGATTPTLQYHIYMQDHLGDNRVVAGANGNIEQINHYYPFGGLMGESWNLTSNQKYKYNGKELDRMHGLDWYDYGARMYDAALGLWHVVDPLAEKYRDVSSYVYCGNNPIKYIDIHGDSLTLTGNEQDQQKAIDIYNDGLGGFYKTSVDNNGVVGISVVEGKDISKMTKSQQAVYDKLKTIIGDKGMTEIKVCSNSENVVIGDISKNTIDVGDIAAIKDEKAITSVSAIMHETYENYLVQVKGIKIYPAHVSASKLELVVTGYFIHPLQRDITSTQLNLQVIYPKPETIIIKLKNGNIDE